MAVKLANAGSVMPAYHDIDNQPGHSDSFLLTTVLREQWGFDGIIVADYGGVSLLHQHHGISHDAAESAALAFNAGLDVELPKDDCARHLAEAVERGLISMAKVDEIVGRVLTEKFRLGLFEHPYADENGIDLQNEATRRSRGTWRRNLSRFWKTTAFCPSVENRAWRWWARPQTIRWPCSAATVSRFT